MQTFHNFKINSADNRIDQVVIEMDGREIQVTSLAVKAGVDGYTNVCAEMPATVAIEIIAALFLTLTENGKFDNLAMASFETAINEQLSDYKNVWDLELVEDLPKALRKFLTTLIENGINETDIKND